MENKKEITRISDLLVRGTKELTKAAGQRLASNIHNAQAAYVAERKKKLDQLLAEKDEMVDLSADCRTTSIGTISAKGFDAENFVRKYGELRIKIYEAAISLKMAMEDLDEKNGIFFYKDANNTNVDDYIKI